MKIHWFLLSLISLFGLTVNQFADAQSSDGVYNITSFMQSIAVNGQPPRNLELYLPALFGGNTQGKYVVSNPWVIDLDALVGKALPGRGQFKISIDYVKESGGAIPANFEIDLDDLFGNRKLPIKLNVDLTKLFTLTSPGVYEMVLDISSLSKIISANQSQALSPEFLAFIKSTASGKFDVSQLVPTITTPSTIVVTDSLSLLLKLIYDFGTGFGGSNRDLLAILSAYQNSLKFKAGVSSQLIVQLSEVITKLTIGQSVSLEDRQALILRLIGEVSGHPSIVSRPKLAKFFIDVITSLKITANDPQFFQLLVEIVDSFTKIPSDGITDLFYITTTVLRILQNLPTDKRGLLGDLVLQIVDRLSYFPNVNASFLTFIPNLLAKLAEKSPDTYYKIIPGILSKLDNASRNPNVIPDQLEQDLINFILTWSDQKLSPELIAVKSQINSAVVTSDPTFQKVLDEIVAALSYLPPGVPTQLAPAIIQILNQVARRPLGTLEELSGLILSVIDELSRRPAGSYNVILPNILDILAKLERRPADVNKALAPLIIEIADTLSKYPASTQFQLKPLINAIVNDVSKLPTDLIENVQNFIIRLIDNLASNKIGFNLQDLTPHILYVIRELASKNSGVPSSIAPLILQFVQSLQNNATDFQLNYIPTIVDLIAHIKSKSPEKQSPLVDIAIPLVTALATLPRATPSNVFPVAKEIIDRLSFYTIDTYRDALKNILDIVFKTYNKPGAEPNDALADIVQYIISIGKPGETTPAELAIDKITTVGPLAQEVPVLKLTLANPDKVSLPGVFPIPLLYDDLPSDAISQGFRSFLFALGNIFTTANPQRPTLLKISLGGAPNSFEPRREFTIDVPYLLSGGKQGSQADILPFLNALGDLLAGGQGKGGIPFLRAIYSILKGGKEAPQFMLGLFNALNGGANTPLQTYPNFYTIVDFLLRSGGSGLNNFSPIVYVKLQPTTRKPNGQTQLFTITVGGGYFGYPESNGAMQTFSLDYDTFDQPGSQYNQVYQQFVSFILRAVTGASLVASNRIRYFLVTVNPGTIGFGGNEQSYLIDANELVGQPGIGATASIRGLLIALGRIFGISVPPPSTFLAEVYRDVLSYQKGANPSDLWKDIFRILTGREIGGAEWSNFLRVLYSLLMTIEGIPGISLAPTVTLDINFKPTAAKQGPSLSAFINVNGSPKAYHLDLNFILFRRYNGTQQLQDATYLNNEFIAFLDAIANVRISAGGQVPKIFYINIINPTPYSGERGPNRFTIDWEYFWTGGVSGSAKDFAVFLQALSYVTDGWNGFFQRFLNTVNYLKTIDRTLNRFWGNFARKDSVEFVTNGVKDFLKNFYAALTGGYVNFELFYQTLLKFFKSIYVDLQPTDGGGGGNIGGGFFKETKSQLDIDGWGLGKGWGSRNARDVGGVQEM